MVLIAAIPSAPPRFAARAIGTMSVMLGVSFASTGRLVPLFNKEEEAMKFPERIRGMKNQEITKLVNVLWEKGVISSDTKPTDFWRVLHELGFYTASDRNWNDQVFFVKRR